MQLSIRTAWKNSRYSVRTTVCINVSRQQMQIENRLFSECNILQFPPAMRKELFRLMSRLNQNVSNGYCYCLCPHNGHIKQQFRAQSFSWFRPRR